MLADPRRCQHGRRHASSRACRPTGRRRAFNAHPDSAKLAHDHAQAEQAWDLLREFTKAEVKEAAASYLDSPSERRRLRAALETVAKRPLPAQGWDPAATEKELLLGVLASDVRLAVRALRDWTDALHVPFVAPASRIEGKPNVAQVTGTVFLKYNCRSQLCYLDAYSGHWRGVLVTFGQEQVGHFPLGLFDEGKQNPAPVL